MTGNAANQERSANAKRVNAINVQQSNCLRLPTAVLTHKPDVVSKKLAVHRNNVVKKETVAYPEKFVNAICVNAIIVLRSDYLNPQHAVLTQTSDVV